MLQNDNPNVGGQIVSSSGEQKETPFIELFIADLRDQYDDVRQAAMDGLVQAGEAAIGPLVAALADPDELVRNQAVQVLSNIGTPQVVLALTGALSNKGKHVRFSAAQALKNIGAEAVEPLIVALEFAPDDDASRLILWTLGKIDDPKARAVAQAYWEKQAPAPQKQANAPINHLVNAMQMDQPDLAQQKLVNSPINLKNDMLKTKPWSRVKSISTLLLTFAITYGLMALLGASKLKGYGLVGTGKIWLHLLTPPEMRQTSCWAQIAAFSNTSSFLSTRWYWAQVLAGLVSVLITLLLIVDTKSAYQKLAVITFFCLVLCSSLCWTSSLLLEQISQLMSAIVMTGKISCAGGGDLQCAKQDLVGADLRGVDLCRVELDGFNLRQANLRGVSLYGANLQGADLLGADLSFADLAGADLRRANLRWAYLNNAALSYGHLNGADLRDAHLEGVYMSQTSYDKHTLWPPGFDPVKNGAVKE